MTPKRIQRKRTKGWRMPENTVYVGRGTMFGNPWTINHIGESEAFSIEEIRKIIYDEYKSWLINNTSVINECLICFSHIENYRKRILDNIHKLKGKNLACWCKEDEKYCHADILLMLANR